MRKYKHELRSIALTEQAVAATDAVLIVTNHDACRLSAAGPKRKADCGFANAMSKVRNAKARIVKA
jgi:hypothetical protein